MLDLPVSVACSRLDEIVDDVRARHEPVFLTRRGRRVAAVIDADDLERLTQAAEELADIEAAEAARAEIAERGTIPWDEVKAGLGREGADGATGGYEPRLRRSLVSLVPLWTGLSGAGHNGREPPGCHPGDSPSKGMA